MLKEAAGVSMLMGNLFDGKLNFVDKAARERTLEGARKYIENLVTGLEQTGQEAKAVEIGRYLQTETSAPDSSALNSNDLASHATPETSTSAQGEIVAPNSSMKDAHDKPDSSAEAHADASAEADAFDQAAPPDDELPF